MRLSLPATASRLMSAIHISFAAGLSHLSLPFHALCGMESGVAPVFFRFGPVGCHPGGPAELTEVTEAHGLNRPRWNGELGIPIELGADVKVDEVREWFAQISVWQESNVLGEGPRIDSDPELVLHAIDAGTEHDAFTELGVALAESRPFRNVEREPRADELINLRFDFEQPANRGGKTRRGFCLCSQQAGEAELGCVGHTVEMPVRFGADPDGRADIGPKSVLLRAVVLRDRARVGPRTEEQLDKAVIENIEKARKRVVLSEGVVVGLLGSRERQRALRPQQPHVLDEEPQRLVVDVFDAGEI